MCQIPGSSSQSADGRLERAWLLSGGVVVLVLIVVAGYLVLTQEPSTAERVAEAVKIDGGDACERATTQTLPPRDEDSSGVQGKATIAYLITCGEGGPVAQVIEYPSNAAVLEALKRWPRSTIYGAQPVCALDTELVFASFLHAEALAGECEKLGGKLRKPAEQAGSN